MDVKLYKAAFSGDVSVLAQLLQEKSQPLSRYLHDSAPRNNPLHTAARLGHSHAVTEILKHQPQFARELNSQGQAPLHLASANGHLQVVIELLQAYPDACYLHDKDGNTPLHRAAMKGRVEVLKELVGANQETAWLLTDQGDPVLHLCVNHNQFNALKTLVEAVDSDEFVKLKDENDNTILHLLAAKDEYKVIKFLLKHNNGIDVNVVNVVNVDGSTALDVARENRSGSNLWKIKAILKKFGAKKARKTSSTWPKKRAHKMQNDKYQNWLNTMKESLIVVAALLASVSFQAALNPPGGVWQESGYHNGTHYNSNADSDYEIKILLEQIPHIAGEAIISYIQPDHYRAFTLSTGLGLFASLSLILLLVSGFSFQRKISIWILIIITWIAVTSMMVTYLISYLILTPDRVFYYRKFWLAVPFAILVWLLICIVFSVHVYRFVRRLPHASGVVYFVQPIVKFLRNCR